MLIRPASQPGPGDRWLEVESLDQAAGCVAAMGRRVFLTTGQGGIEAFAAASGLWFLVRLFTTPTEPLPLSDHETLVGRPPFTRQGEREVLRRHRIDTLVTKNSGGPTAAKLAAARELGLPVVMIRRPPVPAADAAETVEDVDHASVWLRRHLGAPL
jgi:precorrin-6A/cobalt-precorrin-6A reductase